MVWVCSLCERKLKSTYIFKLEDFKVRNRPHVKSECRKADVLK